nr:putative LRR receptor-like serine/threonine-protein kinase [Ipomoea batatas]
MEIHLFWAGKGSCCVPRQGTYGPLISAISATPADFDPPVTPVSDKPPSEESEQKKNRTGVVVGIVVGVGVMGFLSVFVVHCFVQRRKRQDTYDDEEFLRMDVKPYTFSYAELRVGTSDFSPSNKLGEGGFGPVYKGILEDGRIAAVKQLSVASHHGKSQFVAEVATISAVQHRNLVKLYGCCYERDKRLIVYEFLENKSLDQALFGIILKFYAPLLVPITYFLPQSGYLAPEYAMLGHLTEKADVFSFGIVALEIVSGRPNYDSSLEENKMYLLEWAWNLLENKREVDLVDENLSEFNEDEVKRVIGVSLLCTQTSPVFRPPMSRVVAMLSGDTEIAAATTRPSYLADWRFNDLTSFMTHIHDSQDDPSVATTTKDVNSSPLNTSRPLLHEIIGEGQTKNNARNGEEEESNKVSSGPFPHRLSFHPHALSPPKRVNFLQQIEFHALLLQLLHALGQKLPVLFLPLQKLLQMALRVGLVPHGPDDPHGAEERAERRDPRSAAVLLLQPLLQEELVGRALGDLVQRVNRLRLHD